MIKWFFLAIIGIGCGFAIYLYIHLGAFKNVFIEIQTYPETYLVYDKNLGPYHKIGDRLDEIEKELSAINIHCEKTFGHFLDDPNTADSDRLKSEVGCVVSKENFSLMNKAASTLMQKVLPPSKIIYANFQGSPAIGPMKVYPQVSDYSQRQRIKIRTDSMELYTIQRNGQVITEYLFFIE